MVKLFFKSIVVAAGAVIGLRLGFGLVESIEDRITRVYE